MPIFILGSNPQRAHLADINAPEGAQLQSAHGALFYETGKLHAVALEGEVSLSTAACHRQLKE